jgi:hypothetical protein
MRLRSFVPVFAVAGTLGFAACRSGPLPLDDGGLCPNRCAETVNFGGVPPRENAAEYTSYVNLLCCAAPGAYSPSCCTASPTDCDISSSCGSSGVDSSDDGGACRGGDAGTWPPTDCADACAAVISQQAPVGACCRQCLQALCSGPFGACLDPVAGDRPAPSHP